MVRYDCECSFFYSRSGGRDINKTKAKKKTTVWRINPKDVGQPPTAIPPIKESMNLKVTGFARRKNISAE